MQKNITADYQPFYKQQLFHASTSDEVLYGGARGGGKSVALTMEAWQRCVETDGYKVLLLRRSYKQLRRTLLRYMREFFPDELGRYVKSDLTYYFNNGSLIDFGYLDTEADKFEYQGAEYDMIGFEELTQFKKSQYLYLFSSIRSSREQGETIMRATANPGGVGHNWVKERFLDIGEPMKEHKVRVGNNTEDYVTRQYIPATVFDNDYIMEHDPQYIQKLKMLPEAEKEAYLHGNWDIFSGQVFSEFDEDTHVIEPFDIPVHWQKYMSIDWGYRAPFGVVWGAVASEDYKRGKVEIPKGTIVIYREYYGVRDEVVDSEMYKGVELSGFEVANRISMKEEENVHVRIGDYDMFAKRGHRSPTIAEEFAQHGLYLTKPDKARIQGKMQVHKRLRVQDGTPNMYIFNTCENLIRTIPQLPYSTTNPEDVDTDSEDHLYDALRYLLMARPYAKDTRKKKKRRRADSKSKNKYTGY